MSVSTECFEQLELFTPMGMVVVDDRFDDPQFVARVGTYVDQAKSMRRTAAVHPDTVFEMLASASFNSTQYQTTRLLGMEVTVTPKRLHAFRANHTCVSCGIRGNVFFVERHENDISSEYLNLYSASDTGGGMTLMTVDHILPDSWYGRYDPANFQTMCRKCNQKKQHLMSAEEIALIRTNIGKFAKTWVDLEFLDLLLGLQLKVYGITEPRLRSQLEQLLHSYRKRYKHNTHPSEVAQWKVDLVRNIVETTSTFVGGNTCQSTNVGRVGQLDCTKDSWKQRMKRWFVSLAVGAVGLSPAHLNSRDGSQFLGPSKRSGSGRG